MVGFNKVQYETVVDMLQFHSSERKDTNFNDILKAVLSLPERIYNDKNIEIEARPEDYELESFTLSIEWETPEIYDFIYIDHSYNLLDGNILYKVTGLAHGQYIDTNCNSIDDAIKKFINEYDNYYNR